MTKRSAVAAIFVAAFSTLLMSVSMASTVMASTVNLNPGESVLIQPNTSTTVICGNGPAATDCAKSISVFESRYKVCKNSYSASTCFNNEWPAFKTRSPECVVEAFDSCNRTCVESYSSSTCYTNCR